MPSKREQVLAASDRPWVCCQRRLCPPRPPAGRRVELLTSPRTDDGRQRSRRHPHAGAADHGHAGRLSPQPAER